MALMRPITYSKSPILLMIPITLFANDPNLPIDPNSQIIGFIRAEAAGSYYFRWYLLGY